MKSEVKPSGTVMIVEDDEAILEAIDELLAEEGYQVVTAIHGEEALQKLEEGAKPAVILLDLMMPVMDGAEFLQKLSEKKEWSAIPVVLLSAGARLADRAKELGVAGYLSKPIQTDTLLATVSSYCRTA